MKRFNLMALATCLAAATVACGSDQGNRMSEADRPADSAPVGTTGTDAVRDVDVDFVRKMAADSSAEVELGRLAQQKSKNEHVREFAAMMIEDHSKADTELKQVAASTNVTATPEHDAAEDHTDLKERLSKLSGAEFDRAYMDAMVDNHQDAVDAVEDKAEGAANPQVKQWAANTLPALRKHLARAQQIQEMLEQ